MSSPRFGHLVTAMITPFNDAGNIDFDMARDVARFLVDQGNDGLVVAGSTGEGSALSDDEKLELARCVVEAVSVPVLVGSTGPDTARSVELTSRVAATGAAGILATTPSYARPSQRGIAAHLAAVAQATTLPVMLYDIPSRTGRKMASATTIDLVRNYANIVAMKDASGDLIMAGQTKAILGAELDLYSGDDGLILPFIALGAVGLVSVAAHWAAPEFARMIEAALSNEWTQARTLNARVNDSCAFESGEVYPNPIPAKAALRHLGLRVGECRLPLGTSDDEVNARAAVVVDALVAARG